IETMRGRALDLFSSWGYERVMPPMIEFLDSLLTGVGRDMDIQTFKLTDQVSGRQMGIRADMTPQAARIDAHYLKRSGAVRLCYLGAVLRTRPDEFGGSREPLQIGAELFGDSSRASEAEIVSLMIATLELFDIADIHLDLGHVGIFRGLASAAGLDPEQEDILFDAMQRKAGTEIGSLLDEWKVDGKLVEMLGALVNLNGGKEVLDNASKVLKNAPKDVKAALASLGELADAISAEMPERELYFDLAELSGYGYYTGAVFSAFIPGHGRAIAKGGRYDGIGRAFGRDRPATGFSADLKQLLELSGLEVTFRPGILAPQELDADGRKKVSELRAQGERVVRMLPGQKAPVSELQCDRQLVKEKNNWTVKPV
ncbi:MAG: ATP phosphoribosyltransferase regulatory subunit, partial [Acidiferrobacterales bacterium]|nr:ATP phosphoribosyltransferase regulatory subunit [Acidiferrobacterales bacterium]